MAFIKQLERYLTRDDNLFRRFDWWMFSRTVERVDRVTIPYYDARQNRVRDFYPDFIFWLKHGRDGYGAPNYTILFVDPKGMEMTSYQHKIDGYEELFVDSTTNTPRVFAHHGMNVRVALALYTNDANQATRNYRSYWYDSPHQLLERILAPASAG